MRIGLGIIDYSQELSAVGESSGFSSSSLPMILLALDVKVSLLPVVVGAKDSESSVLTLRERSDILNQGCAWWIGFTLS